MESQQVSHGGDDRPQTGPEVTVTVDGTTKKVHRGSYLVSEFKHDLEIDPALQLAQVIDGQPTGLDDDARLVIKGGEVLFTRVRKGRSS